MGCRPRWDRLQRGQGHVCVRERDDLDGGCDTVSELPPLYDLMPPELALLTVLDRPESVRTLLAQVDWGRMPDLARYHRLDGRLAAAITSCGHERAVPSDALATLEEERRHRGQRFDTEVLPQLEEACSALVSAGVEPVLLKGAALVCSGVVDGGERPMADLDLLVAASALAPATRVLRGLGYAARTPERTRTWARANHYQDPAWYHPERPLGLEVHWDLQPRRHRLWFEPATLETVDLVLPSGLRVRRLSDRDLLTHLSLHFWADRANGLPGALGQLWDIRAVSPAGGDALWPDLAEAAARRGHAEVLAVVAACSHLLLGGPDPDGYGMVGKAVELEATRSFVIRRVLAPRPTHIQLLMVTGDVDHRPLRMLTRVAAQIRRPGAELRTSYGALPAWRLRLRHVRRLTRLMSELVRAPMESRAELRLDRWAHRLR
jgi:hypothetical protein